jgi:hypothetical protein
MNRKAMIDHIIEQDKEIYDLISRVIEVIHTHDLWGSEDEYVFKDGEVWHRFDPDYEHARNVAKEQGNNE